MLIAHLTDFHCVPPGQKLGGRLDVNALAVEAVRLATGSEFSPQVLVVTGDLTHQGDEESMRVARAALDSSNIPYIAIPGGHDSDDSFRRVFADQIDAGLDAAQIISDRRVAGHRFIAINTLGDGELPLWTDAASEALDRLLAQAPDVPTVIVSHHPPFQCQIAVKTYYSDPEVRWAEGMKAVVARHPQVGLIPCGHVHRVFHRIWAGALVSSGASTCVQVDPDFTRFWETVSHDRRNISLILEPPGFGLYWWDGKAYTSFSLPLRRDHPRV